MSKYKEVIYMVLDELKATVDDSFFTEEHIMFLAHKYRALLLKQQYSDIKKQIPESNYQTICLDLIEVPALQELLCEGTMLRSKDKIPFIMSIGNTSVYPINYYLGNITYISRDRMKYTGYNKYLQNIIYCSLGPDYYLWFKSSNPQYLYLEKVRMTAIFEDPIKAFELDCQKDAKCNILELEFPLEENLIPILIQNIVQEISKLSQITRDEINDAK